MNVCICDFFNGGNGFIGFIRFAKETIVKCEQHPLQLLVGQYSLWTLCRSSIVTQERSEARDLFVPSPGFCRGSFNLVVEEAAGLTVASCLAHRGC